MKRLIVPAKRQRIWQAPIITASAALALILGAVLPAVGQAGSQTKRPDVLIIYATGNVPPAGAKEDAVTTPTPAGENMKTLSEKLSAALTSKNLTVRQVSVSEKITPKDILVSRIVIMGSPSYWSNVSWQMKKYIDEQFTPFYSIKGRMNKTKAGAFSMAASEPSANRTIEVLKELIVENDGSFGPTMVVAGKVTPEEVTKRIAAFADRIAEFIK